MFTSPLRSLFHGHPARLDLLGASACEGRAAATAGRRLVLSLSSLLAALAGYFTDREHGSRHNLVPRRWRDEAVRRPLWPIYAASPFTFCAVGLLLLAGMRAHPERCLYGYKVERIEGFLWVWQGFASYACDVRDLGIPSISHPVDRGCATLLTVQQLAKYALLFAVGGVPVPPQCAWLVPAGLLAGAHCFRRSFEAVDARALDDFLLWHSAWHAVWPATAAFFFYRFYF